MSSLTLLANLSPTDRSLFYKFSFGPTRPVEFPIIHHSFEHYARLQPQTVAVEHALYNETITYHHLDMRADRLAHMLRGLGIVPGTRVCILGRRSVTLVIAILAVLKSGGQYVPLDASTITDETLHFVIRDSEPRVMLVMEEFAHRLSLDSIPTINLERAIRDGLSAPYPAKVEDLSSPTDGAYCIYTSGTTGQPKGVDVRHQGVTNVISGHPGNVGMHPGMRVAQILNIAFDMGAWEILGALYNGATLCLRGNTSRDWHALLKAVNVVIATPSILASHEPEDYPNIEHVIVGGEPCPQTLADKWATYTSFNNCCGPTEISICNTVQPHTPGYPLSIGKPIPNTNVYVLSRDRHIPHAVPIGQVGCMWVGGIGVSSGYLNLPDKTAEKWKEDPFVPGEGMMFNTGDLVRWRNDGQLEHMGRLDDQVKVKGFRIELDGVATAMRSHIFVNNATAVLVGSDLWGFVTPSTVDLDLVRTATAKFQPPYAVPSRFLALENFPMTRNGKIDKRELHALAEAEKQLPMSRSNDFLTGRSSRLKIGLSSPIPPQVTVGARSTSKMPVVWDMANNVGSQIELLRTRLVHIDTSA